MKKIHEISRAVASLEEQSSGKMVAGFTALAPEKLSAFVGGTIINWNCPCGNTNCRGSNCVDGCGVSKKDL